MAFIEGFLIGLATVIFWGPVFFTLLNGTLQYGIKAGIVASAGIVISDFVAVILCYFASPLVLHSVSQFWLTLAGTLILLGMGIKYLLKPIQIVHSNVDLKGNYYVSLFLKGFIINFTSPFTFAYWIATVSYGRLTYIFETPVFTYIIAVLLGIFFIDVIKVMLSAQIKRLLKPVYLKKISVVCGIILIGFSIRFGWHLITMLAD